MTIEKLKHCPLFKKETLLNLDLLENQGYCNTNYKLKTSQNSYLVRVFKSSESVYVSREFEFKIQKKAYEKNIAAKPLFLDIESNYMVCEFSKGKHKKTLKTKEIKRIAKMVKKLHSIKSSCVAYDFKKALKQYEQTLGKQEARKSIRICKKELQALKKHKIQLVSCHHDLNPKNILFHKKSIKFIDWEYAGSNDAFFDLATLCFEFGLDKKEQNVLLKSYQGKVEKKDIQKLHAYMRLYEHICKLWFMSLNEKTN